MNSERKDFESPRDSGEEPFSDPGPKIHQLINSVRTLEQWYAADLERRLVGLTEVLRNQITAELRSQYSSQLTSQVDNMRRQYEERLYTQSELSQVLEKENQDLRQQLKTVSHEIAATEAILNKSGANSNVEMEGPVSDASSLGKFVQIKVEELERKAYLRGLKFALPRKVIGGPS